jgi:putative ABC transport system permease protein
LQIPEVLQVAGARNHVGGARNEVPIQVEGREQEAALYSVGPAYLTAMGLGVRSGRPFEEGFASDGSAAVMINKTLAEGQGWTDAIGQSLRYGSEVYSVVGVVEDFLIDPYWGSSFPAFFALAGEEDFRYFVLQVEPGAQERVAASLQEVWERHFPETAFEYYPQTAVFEEYHEGLGQFGRNVGYLALFAVLVSCMGLFGIASQRASLRLKEVGVRKALGASPAQIILLINRGFLSMLGVAALVATPLCYVGFSTLLRYVPSDLSLEASPFVVSNLVVFLLAAAALAQQTTRLVKVNPADVLRHE